MKKGLNWFGGKVEGEVKERAAKAIMESLEYILGEANKIVPHDEGTLQRSGGTDINKNSLRGTVYYDTPYAAKLHEHPEYNFQKGRQGKWLEKTIYANKEKIKKYIANKIKW